MAHLRTVSLAFVAAVALVQPASAGAATAVSANWAGYAATGKSVHFRRVSASWTVPAGTCTAGQPSDSVVWVGLGGLSRRSQALEQTGTQFRCTSSGQPVYRAWFELVPAGSHTLHVSVQPGDTISASVTVRGKDVRVSLHNLTRGSGVTFTRRMPAPDTSSADWIVEAPSVCTFDGHCQVEALSNFGSVPLMSASATSVRGHTGTIADRHWSATRIILDTAGNSRFASQSASGAQPSSLSASGSAFSVSYGQAVTSRASTALLLGATRR